MKVKLPQVAPHRWAQHLLGASERVGFQLIGAGVIDELFVAEQKFSVQTTNTAQPELRYSHFYFFFY